MPTCVLWQISNGTQFQQLELHYFDHVLQRNVAGLAACAIAKASEQLPLVTCRKNEVTVKLPTGTKLNRIKAVGRGGIKGILLTGPGAEFVKISTTEDKVKYTKCGFKIVVDKIVHYLKLTIRSFTGLPF